MELWGFKTVTPISYIQHFCSLKPPCVNNKKFIQHLLLQLSSQRLQLSVHPVSLQAQGALLLLRLQSERGKLRVLLGARAQKQVALRLQRCQAAVGLRSLLKEESQKQAVFRFNHAAVG